MFKDFYLIMFYLTFIGGAILRDGKWITTHLITFPWRHPKYVPKDPPKEK